MIYLQHVYVLTNTNRGVASSKVWGGQHIVFTRGQHRDVGITKMPEVRFPKFSASVMMTNAVRLLKYRYYRSAVPVGDVSSIPLSIRHCNLSEEKLILSGYFHSAW